MAMNNVLTAQMARYYNLPCRGAGALTDSPVPDAQAGYESMLNLSMAVSSGVDIILHAAGSLETLKCMSYEKFVLDEELISMMKRVRQGVHVGKESLALEVIAEVGPGGQFLDHDHTFEHFREEIYLPTVSTRDSFSDWLGHGAYYTEKRARTRSMFLLESYTAPDFSDSLARDLNAFIERHGACGPVREAGGLL
jgi:trimethylamine--corrinoid protein Co-methyltransferase